MRNSVASESKVVWRAHFEIEASFSPPKIVRGKITDRSRPLFCDLNLDCEFHHNNLYPKHKTSRSIQKQSNLVPGVVLRNKGKVQSDLWSTTSPSVRPSSSWFIYIWPKLIFVFQNTFSHQGKYFRQTSFDPASNQRPTILIVGLFL